MALQRKDASQLDGDQPGRRKPFVIVAARSLEERAIRGSGAEL
jgi:hypothetical protein